MALTPFTLGVTFRKFPLGADVKLKWRKADREKGMKLQPRGGKMEAGAQAALVRRGRKNKP